MERGEQFEEPSLLRAWGAELCLTIFSPPQVKSPLSIRMWAATLRYAVVVGDLAVLRAPVSFTAELVLGCSPDGTSRVEVMCELSTKFQRLEELCSWVEGPGARIFSMLHGLPPG
jgi:hypothetical protein